MLDKEEMKAFLAMLLAFSIASQLSASRCAALLNASHPTMARWLRMARSDAWHTEAGFASAYHYITDPVVSAIKKLDARDEAVFTATGTGLYAGLSSKAAHTRLQVLQGVLSGRVV
jgi:hypothetical protein